MTPPASPAGEDSANAAAGEDAMNAEPPLIFIADPDQAFSATLADALEFSGFNAKTFVSLQALGDACLRDGKPDAAILSMVFCAENAPLPSHGCDCFKLISEIPSIAVSATDDFDKRLTAFRAGAVRFLTKPVNTDKLIDTLASLTGHSTPDPYRILLIDAAEPQLKQHAGILQGAGMKTHGVTDPSQALAAIEAFQPDVVLMAVHMPLCSGTELAAIIRADDRHTHIPMVFLSGEGSHDKQINMLKQAGDEFLAQPIEPSYLISVAEARARHSRHLQRISGDLHASLRELEHQQYALDQHAIVSIADVGGRITYVNDKFCEISGYAREELLGHNHRIIKSGLHPTSFYQEMWRTISSGLAWQGNVCNRRRNGEIYWVSSTIVPFLDENRRPYQYVSIRTDITHIKQIEEQLRHSQHNLAEAQKIAKVGSWEWDIASDRLEWSDEIYRIFELEPQSFGANQVAFLSRVHPEDLELVKASEERAFQGQGHDVEHRIILPDGAIKWVHELAEVSFDPNGKPMRMTGTAQDITERKLVEERLENSEERLRRGQAYANIGTWDWNIQTGELYWSERIAPLFGHPEGNLETTYENFLNAVHPDDRQFVTESVNACVNKGADYDIEHRIVWPDGSTRWVQERGDVIRKADGTPLRMLGVVQDITARKSAEKSRERLLAILEASPDFIASAHPEGKLFFLNKAGQKILGVEDESAIAGLPITSGQPAWAERLVRQEGLPSAARDGLWVGETALLGDNGSEIPVRQLIISHKTPSGEVEFFSTVMHDLTDQKLAENELILARDSAERANQAKSEFLSSMSHELRTPLNAILGFSQLLESDPAEPLSAEQRDNVAQITRAGWHLLELINEILDLSRIEAGHIDLSIEPVGLAEVIEECSGLAEPLANKRGIRINSQLEAIANLEVMADRTRLKQILLNLLSNAVKYNSEHGSITLSVDALSENRVRVSVTDTGPGLDPIQMDELFQAFNRLGAEKTEVEGTGIGLIISKRIVEMMGGEIGVESAPGAGSTFWFELNAIAPHERPNPPPDAPPEDPVSAGSSSTPFTLLYVEDNPANLKLVAQLLTRRQDIKLVTAHSGTLGLVFALAYKPDIILLDINLPGMDGYELKTMLAENEETRSTPVLALSANVMPRDIEKGLKAGFVHYLTKPVDVSKLMGAIDDVMQTITPSSRA